MTDPLPRVFWDAVRALNLKPGEYVTAEQYAAFPEAARTALADHTEAALARREATE